MGAYVWFRGTDEAGAPVGLEAPFGKKLPSDPHDCIIPWGRGKTAPEKGAVLNRDSALGICEDKARMKRMLEANGVASADSIMKSSAGKPSAYLKVYSVPVFHLEALSVFEHHATAADFLREGGRGTNWSAASELQTFAPPRWIGKLAKTALRAVYTLGLDFAVVHLCKKNAGTYAVVHIDPYPEFSGCFGAGFVQAINRFCKAEEERRRRREQALLGADLEFVLADGEGRLAEASRFFPRKGMLGSDAVPSENGGIAFPLGEIRPEPANDPRTLTARIHRLLQKAAELTDGYGLRLLAGGMPVSGLPLGGHIHFSGIGLNVFLIRALDAYLALPLALIEDPVGLKRRPAYGFPGDVRRQFHGGFEYRTLPSFIVSPRLVLGVLTLARFISEHYRQLPETPFLDERTVHAFYSGDKQALRPIAEALWRNLEQIPQYEEVRPELDGLKAMLFSGKAWNEQKDIRRAWKLSKPPVKV